VFVDYPDLGLTHQPTCLDELVDRETGAKISLSAPPPLEATAAAASQVPAWQRARQTLLALRLGQPPFDSVNELSVGMEKVRDACKWAIALRLGGGATMTDPKALLYRRLQSASEPLRN